jgi:hypothetical protein
MKCDKFMILRKFSEMTGIFVLFYLNEYKRLTPMMLGAAWFTGLRPLLLKLFSRVSIDNIPRQILTMMEKEKVFIKYFTVSHTRDQANILYKLKEQYPDAYFDPNGLMREEAEDDLETVKLFDPTTKTHHKIRPMPDI